MSASNSAVAQLLRNGRDAFLRDWMAEARVADAQHTAEGRGLLEAIAQGLADGGESTDFTAAAWEPLRQLLGDLSASRAAQGEPAGDTSRFVLALKKPVFSGLQEAGMPAAQLAETLWWASTLVDQMAQLTVSTYQATREDIIRRQQHELLELSTPVVKLWEGVLAVPMIGTLDSSRTQLVMESLLQRIVEQSAELAIIDITGVPTVDTLVAQHLLKTVTAIRLMGADCIISGIRPQIAQTIVHLGIDLQGITTKASLADALSLALKRTGHVVTRAKA
jgi:rsbT co-antagonist protein RsbR